LIPRTAKVKNKNRKKHKRVGLSMVVILPTFEVQIRRIMGKGQPE
jgi:hypothetical protein